MNRLSRIQQKILGTILAKGLHQSSVLHAELVQIGEDMSLVTVKRALSALAIEGLLVPKGQGRSTGYIMSSMGRTWADIDAKNYCATDPDKRYGMHQYNFDYFKGLTGVIISAAQLLPVQQATKAYQQRTKHLSATIQKKELERLIIELSWKSSKIEGNTYTILDTEKLILEHKEAPGRHRDEAHMILNHKDAFLFVHTHPSFFKNITRASVEQLHVILVKDLGVGQGLRKGGVGVTGSTYKPLDNIHQIRDALSDLADAVARMKTPYEKALLALAGISYIQPFEDGNKRTARLLANAILLAYDCAPLSYRSVEENEYREATLAFYELNTLAPFRKIFVEQYLFAAEHYALQRQRY